MNVITIDGPSGVGKGATAKAVADRLGWRWLDSGMLYRMLACDACDRQISLQDSVALAGLARALPIAIASSDSQLLRSDNSHIRSEEIGDAASKLAKLPSIRHALLAHQRELAERFSIVADGRDMGTAVFPRAALKIFLTASVDERAKRRFLQLRQTNESVELQTIVKNLRARDERDYRRSHSPLAKAQGAIEMCNDNRSVETITEEIIKLARKRGITTAE